MLAKQCLPRDDVQELRSFFFLILPETKNPQKKKNSKSLIKKNMLQQPFNQPELAWKIPQHVP